MKKGRCCHLPSENILMSIFFTFHPFLTLANKALQREKVNFFRLQTISLKARKSSLFAVRSHVLKIAKKVSLKINCQAIGRTFKILLIDRYQPFGVILMNFCV